MNKLFIITGILCGLAAPIINKILGTIDTKATIYFCILVLFFVLVVAYLILSAGKFYISKVEFLKNTQIVSWGKRDAKQRKFPYVVSLIVALVFGCALIISNVAYLSSLLLALALAFTSLGLMLTVLSRYDAKLTESFILAHMGMFYNEKIYIFNGTTKGITSCTQKDGKLLLTVINKKKELQIALDIPQEKLEETNAFIEDMKEFFDEK